MDEIEYLEEYEDLILPTMSSHSTSATKNRANANQLASMADDEDSSSIDQDIFESLFDDHSDDESVMQKKVPGKFSQRSERNSRVSRTSMDSIDMLVKDLGEPIIQPADRPARPANKPISKQSNIKTNQISSKLNPKVPTTSGNSKTPNTQLQISKDTSKTIIQSDTTATAKPQIDERNAKAKSVATVRPTVQPSSTQNSAKPSNPNTHASSSSTSTSNSTPLNSTSISKQDAKVTSTPVSSTSKTSGATNTVSLQHRKQVSGATSTTGSGGSSNVAGSSSSNKANVSAVQPPKRIIERSQTTIIKPEKPQIKDPAEDPLSLENVENNSDSDTDSFVYSDISADTFVSLSDVDDDEEADEGDEGGEVDANGRQVIELSNDSNYDRVNLDKIRGSTPSPTVSDDYRSDKEDSPMKILSKRDDKSKEGSALEGNANTMNKISNDEIPTTSTTTLHQTPKSSKRKSKSVDKSPTVSDTLIERINTVLSVSMDTNTNENEIKNTEKKIDDVNDKPKVDDLDDDETHISATKAKQDEKSEAVVQVGSGIMEMECNNAMMDDAANITPEGIQEPSEVNTTTDMEVVKEAEGQNKELCGEEEAEEGEEGMEGEEDEEVIEEGEEEMEEGEEEEEDATKGEKEGPKEAETEGMDENNAKSETNEVVSNTINEGNDPVINEPNELFVGTSDLIPTPANVEPPHMLEQILNDVNNLDTSQKQEVEVYTAFPVNEAPPKEQNPCNEFIENNKESTEERTCEVEKFGAENNSNKKVLLEQVAIEPNNDVACESRKIEEKAVDDKQEINISAEETAEKKEVVHRIDGEIIDIERNDETSKKETPNAEDESKDKNNTDKKIPKGTEKLRKRSKRKGLKTTNNVKATEKNVEQEGDNFENVFVDKTVEENDNIFEIETDNEKNESQGEKDKGQIEKTDEQQDFKTVIENKELEQICQKESKNNAESKTEVENNESQEEQEINNTELGNEQATSLKNMPNDEQNKKETDKQAQTTRKSRQTKVKTENVETSGPSRRETRVKGEANKKEDDAKTKNVNLDEHTAEIVTKEFAEETPTRRSRVRYVRDSVKKEDKETTTKTDPDKTKSEVQKKLRFDLKSDNSLETPKKHERISRSQTPHVKKTSKTLAEKAKRLAKPLSLEETKDNTLAENVNKPDENQLKLEDKPIKMSIENEHLADNKIQMTQTQQKEEIKESEITSQDNELVVCQSATSEDNEKEPSTPQPEHRVRTLVISLKKTDLSKVLNEKLARQKDETTGGKFAMGVDEPEIENNSNRTQVDTNDMRDAQSVEQVLTNPPSEKIKSNHSKKIPKEDDSTIKKDQNIKASTERAENEVTRNKEKQTKEIGEAGEIEMFDRNEEKDTKIEIPIASTSKARQRGTGRTHSRKGKAKGENVLDENTIVTIANPTEQVAEDISENVDTQAEAFENVTKKSKRIRTADKSQEREKLTDAETTDNEKDNKTSLETEEKEDNIIQHEKADLEEENPDKIQEIETVESKEISNNTEGRKVETEAEGKVKQHDKNNSKKRRQRTKAQPNVQVSLKEELAKGEAESIDDKTLDKNDENNTTTDTEIVADASSKKDTENLMDETLDAIGKIESTDKMQEKQSEAETRRKAVYKSRDKNADSTKIIEAEAQTVKEAADEYVDKRAEAEIVIDEKQFDKKGEKECQDEKTEEVKLEEPKGAKAKDEDKLLETVVEAKNLRKRSNKVVSEKGEVTITPNEITDTAECEKSEAKIAPMEAEKKSEAVVITEEVEKTEESKVDSKTEEESKNESLDTKADIGEEMTSVTTKAENRKQARGNKGRFKKLSKKKTVKKNLVKETVDNSTVEEEALTETNKEADVVQNKAEINISKDELAPTFPLEEPVIILTSTSALDATSTSRTIDVSIKNIEDKIVKGAISRRTTGKAAKKAKAESETETETETEAAKHISKGESETETETETEATKEKAAISLEVLEGNGHEINAENKSDDVANQYDLMDESMTQQTVNVEEINTNKEEDQESVEIAAPRTLRNRQPRQQTEITVTTPQTPATTSSSLHQIVDDEEEQHEGTMRRTLRKRGADQSPSSANINELSKKGLKISPPSGAAANLIAQQKLAKELNSNSRSHNATPTSALSRKRVRETQPSTAAASESKDRDKSPLEKRSKQESMRKSLRMHNDDIETSESEFETSSTQRRSRLTGGRLNADIEIMESYLRANSPTKRNQKPATITSDANKKRAKPSLENMQPTKVARSNDDTIIQQQKSFSKQLPAQSTSTSTANVSKSIADESADPLQIPNQRPDNASKRKSLRAVVQSDGGKQNVGRKTETTDIVRNIRYIIGATNKDGSESGSDVVTGTQTSTTKSSPASKVLTFSEWLEQQKKNNEENGEVGAEESTVNVKGKLTKTSQAAAASITAKTTNTATGKSYTSKPTPADIVGHGVISIKELRQRAAAREAQLMINKRKTQSGGNEMATTAAAAANKHTRTDKSTTPTNAETTTTSTSATGTPTEFKRPSLPQKSARSFAQTQRPGGNRTPASIQEANAANLPIPKQVILHKVNMKSRLRKVRVRINRRTVPAYFKKLNLIYPSQGQGEVKNELKPKFLTATDNAAQARPAAKQQQRHSLPITQKRIPLKASMPVQQQQQLSTPSARPSTAATTSAKAGSALLQTALTKVTSATEKSTAKPSEDLNASNNTTTGNQHNNNGEELSLLTPMKSVAVPTQITSSRSQQQQQEQQQQQQQLATSLTEALRDKRSSATGTITTSTVATTAATVGNNILTKDTQPSSFTPVVPKEEIVDEQQQPQQQPSALQSTGGRTGLTTGAVIGGVIAGAAAAATATDGSNSTTNNANSLASRTLAIAAATNSALSQPTTNDPSGYYGLTPTQIDSNGTRLYSFLHPAKYNRNHGCVLLDYCCPNLDGPMPAIDPTRIHAQVQAGVRELPAYIVMTTKLITRADLEANKSVIPASIRQKVEKITADAQSVTANQLNASANINGGNTSLSGMPPPLPNAATAAKSTLAPTISALQKQLPSTTSITPKLMHALAMSSSSSTMPTSLNSPQGNRTTSVGGGGATPTPSTHVMPYNDYQRSLLRTSVRQFDARLKKYYYRVAMLSFSDRQKIIDNVITSTNLTPKDVECAVRLLDEYAAQISLLPTPPTMSNQKQQIGTTQQPQTQQQALSAILTQTTNSVAGRTNTMQQQHQQQQQQQQQNQFNQSKGNDSALDKGYHMTSSSSALNKTTVSTRSSIMSTGAGAKNTSLPNISTATSSGGGGGGGILPALKTAQDSPRIFYTKYPMQTSTPIATTTTSSGNTPMNASGSKSLRSTPRVGRDVTVRQIPSKLGSVSSTSATATPPTTRRMPIQARNPQISNNNTTPNSSANETITTRSAVTISTAPKRMTRASAAAKVIVITQNSEGRNTPADECILPDGQHNSAEIKREKMDEDFVGGN